MAAVRAEPVLAAVVAKTGDERPVDLLGRVEQRSDAADLTRFLPGGHIDDEHVFVELG